MKRKDIAVIGLDRFGMSVVDTLVEFNCSVIALDNDHEKVQKIADKVSYASVVDATDEESLISTGIKNVDNVVVSLGSSVENCFLTVIALKNIGVKNISVKSVSDKVSNVLKSLGIQDIITPEKEVGRKTAFRLLHTLIKDFIGIDMDHSIVEMEINKEDLLNKELKDMDFRKRFKLNIVSIKKNGKIVIPSASTKIERNDSVYLIGEDKDIDEFEKYLLK